MKVELAKVLIWGKTYPELSWKHRETVCTGGCDESGRPVRIYPVPLRYLPDGSQYRLWDWIEVPLAKSTVDHRPESFKVTDRSKIKRVGHLTTGKARDWAARRRIIFKDRNWHYECVRDLVDREADDKSSLGFVKVGEVDRVWLEERPEKDKEQHEAKLAELKSQPDLFGFDQMDLEFFPYRVKIRWRCERLTGPRACEGHSNVILDWGLGELGRREGPKRALQKMEELSDLGEYDLGFFMGNFKAHPRNFGIVGVWWPKKKHLQQRDFFTP